MQKSAVLITALQGLEITEPLGAGCQITPGILLTNDFRQVQPYFDHQFRSLIGELEYHTLEQSKALLYTIGNPNSLPTVSLAQNVLIAFLSIAKAFMQSLWLIKDNAISTELGFAQIFPAGRPTINSNFFPTIHSTSGGESPKTIFSRQELRKAISLAKDFVFPCLSFKPEGGLQNLLSALRAPTLTSQPSTSRMSRALNFAAGARAFNDVGWKDVLYCTALESLFSTDATELTHKVSHRIAIFLGNTIEQRTNLFAKVKKAYTFRSKVVHGDVIGKENTDQVAAVCTEIDAILRQIILKIATNPDLLKLFQGSKDTLEKYFLESSFSGQSSDTANQEV